MHWNLYALYKENIETFCDKLCENLQKPFCSRDCVSIDECVEMAGALWKTSNIIQVSQGIILSKVLAYVILEYARHRIFWHAMVVTQVMQIKLQI